MFVHGWPELSISWRHQLPCFAAMGFRAVAPDMRGYGCSSVYPRHEDYALRQSTRDMIELLDSLGREKAVCVGHDWGSPVVWSLGSHHPDRCHGVANLCVPYIPGVSLRRTSSRWSTARSIPRRSSRPGSGTTCCFYEENFEKARARRSRPTCRRR